MIKNAVSLIVCHACHRSGIQLFKCGEKDYVCQEHRGVLPKIQNSSRMKLQPSLSKQDLAAIHNKLAVQETAKNENATAK